MARLLLSLDGQVLAEYNMNKERYTIGRLPDNDVRIDNPAVSGHHALVINILNDSFLEDLNSTNGTYVNGKLIKKHALQHGDVITIGHHQLRFVDEQSEQTGDDEFEKTMIIRPGMTGGPSEEEIHQAVAQSGAPAGALAGVPLPGSAPEVTHASTATVDRDAAPAAAPAPTTASTAERKALPTAKLQVLSGAFAGKELSLIKALTTLGRPGVQVAAITRRAEGYFVVHVESGQAGNYPIVNGKPIGPQARKLVDNDVIELAGVKMGFFTT
ncbi:MAG: FHA domain-containing protein [Gammaproteobacteria bacterium]|nr:FHA domain-containing protein [Gammaproteobacteria bacterium]